MVCLVTGCADEPGACVEKEVLRDFSVRAWCANVDRPAQCPENQDADPWVWEYQAGKSCDRIGFVHDCGDNVWEDLVGEC